MTYPGSLVLPVHEGVNEWIDHRRSIRQDFRQHVKPRIILPLSIPEFDCKCRQETNEIADEDDKNDFNQLQIILGFLTGFTALSSGIDSLPAVPNFAVHGHIACDNNEKW